MILPDRTPRPDLGYFEGRLRNTLREDTGSIKVDYNASSKDTFSFRYNIADSFTSTQYAIALDQISPSTSRNHLLKGTWNHTFRPNLLNEFGVAFNRPQTDSLGGGGNFPVFQCVFCSSSNTFGATPDRICSPIAGRSIRCNSWITSVGSRVGMRSAPAQTFARPLPTMRPIRRRS